MKRIVLTGGGTAGHITPNIALMPELEKRGYRYFYIGSYDGMEKEMIESLGVRYFGVSTGKLRRYFSLRNFTDPARVVKGYLEARKWLKKIRPHVVFSKGGFVSVPVVLAAHHLGIPVVIHESDMSPGLANKISIPSADAVCCNFHETVNEFPEGKAILTGSPIRQELFEGSREAGLSFCGFSDDKPVLLIIGGSLGSVAINDAVRHILPQILPDFHVVHLCGKGNLDESLNGTPGYVQYEFISKELPDLMAAADIVISRAGANAICELLALRKPNILIPLPAIASRGDQLQNAASFEKQGFSCVLQEEDVTDELLLKTIHEVFDHRQSYIDTMTKSPQDQAITLIADLLDKLAQKKKK